MEVNMIRTTFSVVAASMLAAVSAMGFIPTAQAEPITFNKVSFTCVEMDGKPVTQLQEVEVTFDSTKVPAYQEQAMGDPSNVIIWTATLASDNPQGTYTPKSRCEAVSAHLNNLASALGITSSAELSPLLADITQLGMVNSQKVIFPAYQNQAASDENVIFTLKPDNADKSSDVLAQFQIGISPGVGGPDLPVNLQPPVVE